MPALCQAGVLVECCASEVEENKKSDAAPNECPNKCPNENRERCPDDTGSSGPRDCDTCADACNVISRHVTQVNDDDVAVMSLTQVLGDLYSLHQHRSRDLSTLQPSEHVPIPASDRPLLI